MNISCVVDTETTGLAVNNNHIIEICILPPKSNIPAFNTLVIPRDPSWSRQYNENTHVSNIRKDDIINNGIESGVMHLRILQWMDKHDISTINPIVQNWSFDSKFLEKELTFDAFSKIFTRDVADTRRIAKYINDRYFIKNGVYLWKSTSLTALAEYFEVKYPDRAHRAYDDCVVTAKVYDKLLEMTTI